MVCTLFGGADDERVQGVLQRSSGNILTIGETTSEFGTELPAVFPNNPGYDHDYYDSPGKPDAYLAILDGTLTTVLYWTYLGGDGDDRAYSAVEDSQNKIWVSGITRSVIVPSGGTFPVEPATNSYGASAATVVGGFDVFVASFSFDLLTLESCLVIGGSQVESPRGTITVSTDYVYVSGFTTSGPPNSTSGCLLAGTIPFYVTTGMPGLQLNTGCDALDCGATEKRGDGFILQVSRTTGLLNWSRCLGGDDHENALGNVRVHPSGDIFISGCTKSSEFDLTATIDSNAVVTGSRQGAADGFIARLSAAGAVLKIIYIGGSGTDWVAFNDCMELDALNRPVVIGITRSLDFPCTQYALSNEHSQFYPSEVPAGCVGYEPCSLVNDCSPDSNDVFVAIASANLSTLVYASYVNKVPGACWAPKACYREEPAGLAIHRGNIYISGETDSPGFPITANAFDPTISDVVDTSVPYDQRAHDAFLVKFFPGLTAPSILHYSTFFGGDLGATGATEPGNRGRCLTIVTSGPHQGLPLMSGMTTTHDFGSQYTPHMTTSGVVLPQWLEGPAYPFSDKRSGFICIHDTN